MSSSSKKYLEPFRHEIKVITMKEPEIVNPESFFTPFLEQDI